MTYPQIQEAIFLSRPNRFIAEALLDGKTEICHVKNTGRCRELLIPGARVFLSRAENPARATRYDLVAVYKGGRLINMDSQAPNKAFLEYLRAGRFLPGITRIKPEAAYGGSRFDFRAEAGGGRFFIEVKGVTLEKDGVALFPDAPTQRGARHLRELAAAVRDGCEAHAVFVIQMRGVRYFTPNRKTDPAFGDALRAAVAAGVKAAAIDCEVTPDSLELYSPVPIRLDG